MQPYYEENGITIYHGDCREVLPTLADKGIDLVLSDPPYGTGGWRRSESGAGSNPAATLVREDWDDGLVDWVGLVPCDVIISFWSSSHASHLLNAANDRGLTKHRLLYWRKPDPKPQPGGRTRWSVEPIWVLSRDGFQLYGSNDDVCEVSALRAGQPEATGHPYQKPIKVMRWVLAKSKLPGVTLDPFMGSGSTLRAAKDLGRRCIGIEANEAYCEIAARRLQQSAHRPARLIRAKRRGATKETTMDENAWVGRCEGCGLFRVLYEQVEFVCGKCHGTINPGRAIPDRLSEALDVMFAAKLPVTAILAALWGSNDTPPNGLMRIVDSGVQYPDLMTHG